MGGSPSCPAARPAFGTAIGEGGGGRGGPGSLSPPSHANGHRASAAAATPAAAPVTLTAHARHQDTLGTATVLGTEPPGFGSSSPRHRHGQGTGCCCPSGWEELGRGGRGTLGTQGGTRTTPTDTTARGGKPGTTGLRRCAQPRPGARRQLSLQGGHSRHPAPASLPARLAHGTRSVASLGTADQSCPALRRGPVTA